MYAYVCRYAHVYDYECSCMSISMYKMRLYELYDYVQRCENFSGVYLH